MTSSHEYKFNSFLVLDAEYTVPPVRIIERLVTCQEDVNFEYNVVHKRTVRFSLALYEIIKYLNN